jgi:MFS family permease
LFAASAVSNLGDGIVYVCGPLLAASLTRDPLLVAFTMFSRSVPWLLFGLLSGALVDRLDRRRVMGLANGSRASIIGTLGLAVLFDTASLPLLYASFFLLGLSETFFDNASQTALPGVVTRENLEKANGRLESARIVSQDLAGPSLGGFLFGVAAAIPFLLNAGAFAAAAALVLAMRGGFRAMHPDFRAGEVDSESGETSVLTEVRDGILWLARRRFLLTLAAITAVLGLVDEAVFAVFVLYAQEILGLRDFGYGLLLAVGAAGGIFGGFTADTLVQRVGSARAIFLSLLLGTLSYAGIAVTGSVALVAAMLVVNGPHLVLWNVTTLSLRQSEVSGELLGRVNGTYHFLAMVGLTSGTLFGGVVASAFGLVAPFWFATASLAILSFVALAGARDSYRPTA